MRNPREADVPGDPTADNARIAELTAIVEAVRERVRARYPQPNGSGHPSSHGGPVSDLMPIVHARDAAQAKIAAIGSVNPRADGILNQAIQYVKKTVARSLQWFVRDQIAFNREAVSAIEAVIEVLNDHNRALQDVAALKDLRSHWGELRADWDRKVAANEIQFLRGIAELQGAFQHRTTQLESNFREHAKLQHANYLGALDRANIDIQQRLWADLEKIRQEYDRLIHTELRLIRQRAPVSMPAPSVPAPAAASSPEFDYGRFAERFRGPEEYVGRNVEFYRPFFAKCENVLDIGCGRGEFLALMRDQGIAAKGIDLSEESVAQCAQIGLSAEAADLFSYLGTYLNDQPEQTFDGIFSSQVVEHLDPRRLPEMIRLCASRLRRGGLLAIETPNPGCLAIFATHFYLDPTHTRPIPHPLMSFYMEEAGFGQVEVHELSPAVESMPELAELPEAFRKRFFGGLDYAIVGRKL
jgi:O-antigen chain-terminating methyltransferase